LNVGPDIFTCGNEQYLLQWALAIMKIRRGANTSVPEHNAAVITIFSQDVDTPAFGQGRPDHEIRCTTTTTTMMMVITTVGIDHHSVSIGHTRAIEPIKVITQEHSVLFPITCLQVEKFLR
jgi:hypothetical protein